MILQKIIDFIYVLFLTIRGGNRLRIRPPVNETGDEITVVTLKNYTLTIYCKEIIYKTYYKKFYIQNKQRKIYQLYARCTKEAPDALKNMVESHVYLPNLTPNCISWEISRKQLISAYLDILITRFRNIDA